MPWDPSVENAIGGAAQRFGVDPKLLKTFATIESGGRPNARTGSYKGLFQLSDGEFGKFGGGNIYDPAANANAAAQKLASESAKFRVKYGRDPAPNDLYIIHQQGEGGYAAHAGNPSAPAWQNMHSTAEGRQKGPGWAKQAIWGNVPSDVRAQYPGGVDSLTSQQFLDLWKAKVERLGGGSPSTAVAQAQNTGEPTNMQGQIGGAPVAGGPMPMLDPPSIRKSKLAEALLSQSLGAKVTGWGDALRSLSGTYVGQQIGDKYDTEQKAYRSSLAEALGGATNENLASTLIGSGDDNLVNAGVQLKVAQAKPQATVGRFRPSKQGIVDTVNGTIVPGTASADTESAEYGTSPQYFVDKNGDLKVGQLSKAGGMKAVDLPEGAKAWSPGIDYKDTGTGFVGVNKRTGQVESNIAKDIAGKEAAEVIGKTAGQAQVGIPAAKTALDNTFKTIGELEKHPGIGAATGLSNIADPRSWLPGTEAYNFLAKNTQAMGQSFMAAREALKGAGQVTDFEGAKGEQAIANLDPKQGQAQYLEALKTLKQMMQASYDDMLKKASMAGSPADPNQPRPVKTMRFNPQTGEIE
jgi:hypothetical protein